MIRETPWHIVKRSIHIGGSSNQPRLEEYSCTTFINYDAASTKLSSSNDDKLSTVNLITKALTMRTQCTCVIELLKFIQHNESKPNKWMEGSSVSN